MKVIFHSPQAKCVLMENSPLNDVEMHFYDGTKVHNSVSKGMMTITLKGEKQHCIDLIKGESAVPVNLLPIFRHTQECLKQCVAIERNSSSFPVILKCDSTPMKTEKPSIQLTQTTWETTPAPSIHTRSQSVHAPVKTISPMALSAPSPTLRSPTPPIYPTSIQVAFLQRVGWCLRHVPTHGTFTLLFHDGAKIVLDSKRVKVWENGIEEDWIMDKSIPDKIKRKLAYLPDFIKELKKG
jgi:hypothetical protein